MKVTCEKCGTILNASDQLRGKKVQCKKCQFIMRVPLETLPDVPVATGSMANLFGASAGNIAQITPTQDALVQAATVQAPLPPVKAVPAPIQKTMLGVVVKPSQDDEAVVEAQSDATMVGVLSPPKKLTNRAAKQITLPPRQSASTAKNNQWLPWAVVGGLLLIGIPLIGWLLLRDNTSLVATQLRNATAADKASTIRYGKHAAIEISSSSIRMVVVDLSLDENGENDYNLMLEQDTEVKRPKTEEYQSNKKAYLELVSKTVQTLVSQATSTEWGVDLNRVYVLADASSAGNDEQVKELDRAVRIANRELKPIKRNEAIELNFNAVVPPKFRDDAVIIDFGSSALRLGCYDNKSFKPFVHVDANGSTLGYSHFYNGVMKGREAGDAETFRSDAEDERFSFLKDVRTHVKDNPVFTQKKQIYLLGGISWSLAVLTRPKDCLDTFRFTLGNINDFSKAAAAAGANFEAYSEKAMQGVSTKINDPVVLDSIRRQVKGVQQRFFKEKTRWQVLVCVPYVYECLDIVNYQNHSVQFFPKSHLALCYGYILKEAQANQR